MFQATRNIAQKLGSSASAKATAVGTALMVPFLARAADDDMTQIITGLKSAMSDGKTIAVTVVLGFFAIYGIKLLWRAK